VSFNLVSVRGRLGLISNRHSNRHLTILFSVEAWPTMDVRHGTGSHFVTHRPSDPGIQRPGDPVDPVTLFCNELQMSTYVADKRLQWATGLLVFIAVWRLHASGK